MSLRRLTLLALLFSALGAPGLRAERALLRVEGADAVGLRDLRAALEAEGARLPHLRPPDVLLGEVPAGLLYRPEAASSSPESASLRAAARRCASASRPRAMPATVRSS